MNDKVLFTIKMLITLAVIAVMAALGVASYNAGFAIAEERMAEASRELIPVCTVNVREDSSLRVRENATAEAKVLHHLAAGMEVAVVRQLNGWALIIDPDLIGIREPLGWVHTDYLLFAHKHVWSK